AAAGADPGMDCASVLLSAPSVRCDEVVGRFRGKLPSTTEATGRDGAGGAFPPHSASTGGTVDAVEIDGQDDHGDAAFEGRADVQLSHALDDDAAESLGANETGDHDHRQREHDHLVDARHDG